MDNFSYQLHTIPDRISQLTVLRYEIKFFESFLQIYPTIKLEALKLIPAYFIKQLHFQIFKNYICM